MCDTTLDWIIDLIDALARNDKFKVIDDLLEFTNVEYLLTGPQFEDGLDICLGMLTSTLCMKSRLSEREQFYQLVLLHLRNTNETEYTAEELLSGLE